MEEKINLPTITNILHLKHRTAKIIFFSAAWNIFGKLYVF
jgi:hypothetical protein